MTEKEHADLLLHFFLWFRENGPNHYGKTAEQMIQVYIESIKPLTAG